MPRSPAELFRHTVEVLRAEGAGGIALRSFRWARRLVGQRSRYLVFFHDLCPSDFGPSDASPAMALLASSEDLARLPATVREQLDANRGRLTAHLAAGGTVWCALVEGKLAHQSWVSTRLPSVIDPIAPYVDYDGTAYIGACETSPEFRGMGLYPLVLTRICQELARQGLRRGMLTVSPENHASISGVTKAGFVVAGYGTLTRFLGHSRWSAPTPTAKTRA